MRASRGGCDNATRETSVESLQPAGIDEMLVFSLIKIATVLSTYYAPSLWTPLPLKTRALARIRRDKRDIELNRAGVLGTWHGVTSIHMPPWPRDSQVIDNPEQIGKQEPGDHVSDGELQRSLGTLVVSGEGNPKTGGRSGMKACLLCSSFLQGPGRIQPARSNEMTWGGFP